MIDAGLLHCAATIAGLPRRLRFGLGRAEADATTPALQDEHLLAFVAYAEDCILSGEAILDAERLTDMLNDHDEYQLADVTVERFDDAAPDGGAVFEVAEIVIPRDEIFLVHAAGPRGDPDRRHRTMPHHLAMPMGPYQVRGFFHALPGADPVEALRRRKAMVPITDARIA